MLRSDNCFFSRHAFPAQHYSRWLMSNTYTQIYIHGVFAVEGRQNLIRLEHNDELQKYISGIISGQKQKLIAINNMPDHVHLLIGLKPDLALSELMRDIKAGSSKFINEKQWVPGRFGWQEGFGAFSYARSQLDTVVRYIRNQPEHHARKTFQQDYVELLKKYEINYDELYILRGTTREEEPPPHVGGYTGGCSLYPGTRTVHNAICSAEFFNGFTQLQRSEIFVESARKNNLSPVGAKYHCTAIDRRLAAFRCRSSGVGDLDGVDVIQLFHPYGVWCRRS